MGLFQNTVHKVMNFFGLAASAMTQPEFTPTYEKLSPEEIKRRRDQRSKRTLTPRQVRARAKARRARKARKEMYARAKAA